jgi:hypothetical protein
MESTKNHDKKIQKRGRKRKRKRKSKSKSKRLDMEKI